MKETHDTANRAKPGLLFRRGTLLALAAMLALSMAASPALGQGSWTESTTGDASGADSKDESGEEHAYTEDELRMVEQINTYREEEGLSPLKVSHEASEAASNHSSDMAKYDFFGHETKDSDTYEPGADVSTRMDEAGYDYETVRSENLAAGSSGVAPTLEQWKTSPGHNENMLREDLKVVGIGKACSDESTHGCYWTTTFGGHAPDDARPTTEIEPSQEEQDSVPSDTGSAGGSGDTGSANSSGENSSSTTDLEQSTNENNGSNEDSSTEDNSTEDSSGSKEDSAEPRIEVVEKQNSGEEGSPDSGWGGESTGGGGSSDGGSGAEGNSGSGGSSDDGSGESQQAVQITQNGETKTLTGDEASEEICKQFGETREEVISSLREDTGSGSGSDAGSSGSTGGWSTGPESGSDSEGSGSEDPAAAIKNDIADDFEESLLNPESCQGGGDQSSDSAEGTTDESTSGEDASGGNSSSDDASSDQYAEGEDNSGEDSSSEDASSEDSSSEDGSNEGAGAGSDQYTSEGSDQEASSDDASQDAASKDSSTNDEDSAMEDTSMADEASGEASSGETTSGESTSDESTSDESTSSDSSGGNDGDEGDAGEEDSGISMLIFWK